MSTCYACHAILNKANRSVEHIIPNAIGGVLKSYRLLCRQCNMRFGATLDAALYVALAPEVNTLNIVRDRRHRPNGKHSPYHLPDDAAIRNDMLLRAVAKTAVNYYLTKVRGIHQLAHIISVINGTVGNNGCVYRNKDVHGEEELSHRISVTSDAALGSIIASITLFGRHNYTVVLCSCYKGDTVQYVYSYTLTT